ncbi:MAG: phage portal protein [Cellulosilyticaceae bacterium]
MAAIKVPFLKWLSKDKAQAEVEAFTASNKVEKIVPPTDPFDNPIFAYCVDLILMACNSLEYKCTTKNGDVLEKPNEKAQALFNRPNMYYNRKKLISHIMCSYLAKGAGYALFVEGAPGEMYFAPFDKVKIEYGDNLLTPIKAITVDGSARAWEQLIVLNAINPADDKYGLSQGKSKVDALKSTLDTHNIIRMKNAEVIAKYEKQKALINESEIHDEGEARKQARVIKEQLKDHGDGGTAVLFGKFSAVDLSETVEGDFLETYMTMGREICQRLGVPTDIVFGQSKYENMKEAIKAFIKQTILPPMEELTEELNNKVYEPKFGVRYEIDYSAIEELQKSIIEYLKAVGQSLSRYVAVNEFRNLIGMNPLDGPQYDEVDDIKQPDKDTPAPQPQQAKKSEVVKSKKSLGDVADAEEHKLIKKYQAYFDTLHKRLKKQLNSMTKADEEEFFDVEDIYDSNVEVALIRDTTQSEYVDLYESGWKLLDKAKDKIPRSTKDSFLERIGEHIKAIDDTTKNTIKDIIEENVSSGTVKQAKKQILDSVKAMSDGRAKAIARTETFSALEQGQYGSAKALGMLYKRWSCSSDERTRPEHKALHGKTIKIDESFTLRGKRGKMPRDQGFDVSDIVNCRCTLEYTNQK